MSSENIIPLRPNIWASLSTENKGYINRYYLRTNDNSLQNLGQRSILILINVQRQWELNNPTGTELDGVIEQLRQEAEAIRQQLQNLAGQNVQNLQNNIQTALGIQARIEEQEQSVQAALDLSSEIQAAQDELIRRLQPPSRPTPQPTQPPLSQQPNPEQGLEPGTQPNPNQAGEGEENQEGLESIDIFSSLVPVPIPDITPPLDSTLALREYLQLRDSNNIRYTIPYIIDGVVNEYRLTEFLDEPLPRFYNTVNTFIDNYIAQNFRSDDESQLNANERSIVAVHRAKITNMTNVLQSLPQLNDYRIISNWQPNNNFNVEGVPYPHISTFRQATEILRDNGVSVRLRTATSVAQRLQTVPRRILYQQTYVAQISSFVNVVNLAISNLQNQINTVIQNSHIRAPLRIQLDKQIADQDALLEKANLTEEVYNMIVQELDQTTALLRKLGEVHLEFEQSKLTELTTDFRELADKLDETIQEEQDDILGGLAEIGNFFASPVLALTQALTSLLDPDEEGVYRSLDTLSRAQARYARLNQNAQNQQGGI